MRKQHNFLSNLACTLTLLFALAACQPLKTDLPFETIEQKIWAGTGEAYRHSQPGLMVIARPEETSKLDNLITQQAHSHLQTLDYSAYFALVVFQGLKGSGGYTVEIERVTRQGNRVTISVQFQEPQPSSAVISAVTSPYHLVRVSKSGTWDELIEFTVVASGRQVLSVLHRIS